MLQSPTSTTATEQVVARLVSQGWVNCPQIGFPALCQHALPDLRRFVLERLEQEGNWMREIDLQLTVLVFSIPSHEFQFHPHLAAVLEKLVAERVIEIQEFGQPTLQSRKRERAILLKAIPDVNEQKIWGLPRIG